MAAGDQNGEVQYNDLSVEDSDALDIEMVWLGQSVRVRHVRGAKWFTLIVSDGSREQAALKMDTLLAYHLAELLSDVHDRVTDSEA